MLASAAVFRKALSAVLKSPVWAVKETQSVARQRVPIVTCLNIDSAPFSEVRRCCPPADESVRRDLLSGWTTVPKASNPLKTGWTLLRVRRHTFFGQMIDRYTGA